MALPNRLTLQQKAQFFSQLAALLHSGISIQHSLIQFASENFHPSFQRYLNQVSMAVDAGQDLASALALNAHYFDSWTIALIRLAQYSGSLSETCRQLAINLQAEARRKRLMQATRFLAIATIWSLLIVAAAILNPNPTAIIKPEFWLRSLAIALLLLAIGVVASRYSSYGSRQLTMKLPVIGKLIQARSLLYLAQLRLPLSCGVPLLTAVEFIREHVPDPVMRANLSSTVRQIRRGQSLSYSLDGKIPPIAMQMIRTGEETGNLDTALESLAQHYEHQLEQGLRFLQGSLQPLSLVAIASLVAVVAVRGLTILLNVLPD